MTSIDEAIAGLPRNYRETLILHDIQGFTTSEVAELLNCMPRTIAMRITRGRSLLRRRLERHGLAFSTAEMLALLAQDCQSLTPSPEFIQTCSRAAVALAQNKPIADIVNPNVQALMKEVLDFMFWRKIKWAAVGCLVLMLVLAGAAILRPENLPQATAEGNSTPEIPAEFKPAFIKIARPHLAPEDKVETRYMRKCSEDGLVVRQNILITIRKPDGAKIWIMGQNFNSEYAPAWNVKVLSWDLKKLTVFHEFSLDI